MPLTTITDRQPPPVPATLTALGCPAFASSRFALWRLTPLLLICGFALARPLTPAAATYGQEVLAAVLLAEARGEGETGMRAVAEVVRRRADERGVSMLSVLKPGAFSSLNGTNRDALLRRFRRHPQFADALKLARLAYNQPSALGDLTRGANHFTHKREKPYWSVGHRPVAVIGNHAFYRIPSPSG